MKQRSPYLWIILVLVIGLGLTMAAARAVEMPPAADAVHRLMAAYQANDREAFLAAIADDYDYNGRKKSDFDPFGDLWALYDRLHYQVTHYYELEADVATAIVDSQFTGRFNLEALGLGQPPITGTSRLWVEVRRQQDSQWRVTALRPVRIRFTHADSIFTWVEVLQVNDASSLQVTPGTALKVEGQTSFGLGQFVGIGTVSQRLSLTLKPHEDWAAELEAPTTPGRYFVDATSVILSPREDGGLYLAWDETTVPVNVR
jgi:hypothetical protein